MGSMPSIPVVVSEIKEETPTIKTFTLIPAYGGFFPPFSGGSHVVVHMEDNKGGIRNPYSLISSPENRSFYQIAVLKQEASQRGSYFMHKKVKVGTRLEISLPFNSFPMVKQVKKILWMAGGIGITPFLPQREELQAYGIPFELHYCIPNRQNGAFIEELQEELGERLHLHVSNEGTRLDGEKILQDQPLGTHLFLCGPSSMVEEITGFARDLGWPTRHVHFEKFQAGRKGNPFTAYLSQSGKAIEVPTQSSLLEVLEKTGIQVPNLCRGGACGQCQVSVLGGEVDHRDSFLQDIDKGSSMLVCVSRARGEQITLDL